MSPRPPLKLSGASSARPLVLLAAFAYGLSQRRSDIWVTAALLLLAEGMWWASKARTAQGAPYALGVVFLMGLAAVALGPFRSGAWLVVLVAEWLVRPALWDGGIISHARRRWACRKARKLRAHAAHAEGTGDGITLAAAAARVETAAGPQPVEMRFVSGVVHTMSDGSQRWEELAR
jgi:hypothetical protein